MMVLDFGLNITGDSWTEQVEYISAQRRLSGEVMTMTATNSTNSTSTGVASLSARRRFYAEDGEESQNIGSKDFVGFHRLSRRKGVGASGAGNSPVGLNPTSDIVEMDFQAVVFFMSFTFVGRSAF
jgi:hypothetical protein